MSKRTCACKSVSVAIHSSPQQRIDVKNGECMKSNNDFLTQLSTIYSMRTSALKSISGEGAAAVSSSYLPCVTFFLVKRAIFS
jgi:hypothetical protein